MTRGEKCAPERYVYLSRIGTIAFYHSVIGHLYINVPNDLIETPDRDRFFTHVLKSMCSRVLGVWQQALPESTF